GDSNSSTQESIHIAPPGLDEVVISSEQIEVPVVTVVAPTYSFIGGIVDLQAAIGKELIGNPKSWCDSTSQQLTIDPVAMTLDNTT
ncbi:hypothetical protein A2U01_0085893, partial [Trifolium medium]|nr:hypothetical protein [Trifolium medium]